MGEVYVLLLALSLAAFGADPGFDHQHTKLDTFLEGAVDGALVRYDVLATRRATLSSYLDQVATAPVGSFSEDQQLAFWINAYNALTLATVLDAMPLKSILDLEGGQVWKKRTFAVAGERLTLDQIEQDRIRRLGDGRIHAVVNCASKGCPPLPPDPVVATRLSSQLDAGVHRWLDTNAFAFDGTTLRLSMIFDWYAIDFVVGTADLSTAAGKQQVARDWLASHAAEPPMAAKLGSAAYTVAWLDYDWALNAR